MSIATGRLRAALAFFFFFMHHGAGAHAAELVGEAPFRFDYQGWLTIEATVNGEGPYDFIVDTGATVSVVFANLAQRQDFAPAAREPMSIIGLSGVRELPAIEIGAIAAAGLKLEDHVGVSLKDWGGGRATPQGVLGLDFFSDYVVHFDLEDRMARFYAPEDFDIDDAPGRWRGARLEPRVYRRQSDALFESIMSFGSRRVPCLVDLGASGTILNYAALTRLRSGVYVDRTRASRLNARVHDIFGDTDTARVFPARSLKLGRTTFTDHQLIVFDAPVFDDLGVGNLPYCLLGADIVASRSFILDFQGERMWFAR